MITALYLAAWLAPAPALADGWLLVRGEAHQMFRGLGDPQTRGKLFMTAALIGINWGIFMWGTANNHVVEVSLGYFIAPLLNVALGMIVFRERLNRAQTLAVIIAAAGVIYLTWSAGRPPWLSIGRPRAASIMAVHSMCQPGRPGPQGLSHSGSPGFDGFQSTKSRGSFL